MPPRKNPMSPTPKHPTLSLPSPNKVGQNARHELWKAPFLCEEWRIDGGHFSYYICQSKKVAILSRSYQLEKKENPETLKREKQELHQWLVYPLPSGSVDLFSDFNKKIGASITLSVCCKSPSQRDGPSPSLSNCSLRTQGSMWQFPMWPRIHSQVY